MIIAQRSFACDPCALYNASRLQGMAEKSLTLSVSEQFTDYDSVIDEYSFEEGELIKGYSTMQFGIEYDFTDRFGAQLTIPVVIQRGDRFEHFEKTADTDSGIGDLSVIGSYSFLNIREIDWCFIAGIIGGVKFPTGDAGTLQRLAPELGHEEQSESQEEEAHSHDQHLHMFHSFRHHPIASTSGGRALTRGTGSYDYIIGANLLARYNRQLFLADSQYTIRTEGDFDYEFADDLIWSVGPGYYMLLKDTYSVATRLSFSGEFKGKDRLEKSVVRGSQVSNLYLGPEILVTIGESIGGQIGVDFRVSDQDKDAQVVPDFRIKSALSYRF